MDKELVDYIITYYTRLLGLKEKMAQKHHLASIKSDNEDDSKLKDMILRQWGTTDKETLDLLDNGYDEFKRVSAEKS